LNNTPIKIFGNGQQTRTFVHVTDVINAIVQLMEQNNIDGEVFNIGGNQEITIEDLAKRVVKETASTSEITYLPYEKAFSPDFEDIQRRVPSVEKLQKVIDWEPMYSLDAILSNIINEVQKS
jgi:UDP-glucose 4-epimerase